MKSSNKIQLNTFITVLFGSKVFCLERVACSLVGGDPLDLDWRGDPVGERRSVFVEFIEFFHGLQVFIFCDQNSFPGELFQSK